MKIAVIAGTSDATDLIRILSQRHQITAFTATDYGKEILKTCNCAVSVGRLDFTAFAEKLCYFDIVIDASHPFAQEVTKIVKAVCKNLGLTYLRLLRPAQVLDSEMIHVVDSKEEACELLSGMPGNILLTTGVQTLAFYEKYVKDFASRGFVRVLDTPDSRKIAKNSQSHVIYAMPPFTEQDLSDLIQKYQISVLVSKDSGIRGGLDQKFRIAEKFRIPVILIRRPQESGMQMQEILEYFNQTGE